MTFLCDANLWIALAIERHPHHGIAKRWLDGVDSPDRVGFNRATQTAFLRLVTQPIARGYAPVSQKVAWRLYDAFLDDERIVLLPEPVQVELLWRRLTSLETASPKHWMDGYLAAFAIATASELVTLDQGYLQFKDAGLRLRFLGQ